MGTTATDGWLGIDGGGTRTRAAFVDSSGRREEYVLGPGNLQLLSPAALVGLFRSIRRKAPRPVALGIGLAGARTEADRRRIRDAAAKVWRGVPCAATHDLEIALRAARTRAGGVELRRASANSVQVLVLSGTGSCCYGRRREGMTARTGGWGHHLGDRGSGYDIALRALRTVLEQYDHTNRWPQLGERLLRALQLNEPDQLVHWIQSAGKPEIAALAREVFTAAKKRDRLAGSILKQAAEALSQDAVACARRLTRSGRQTEFVLAGSSLTRQPGFAGRVSRRLKQECRGCDVRILSTDPVWGAVALARALKTLGARPATRRTQTSPGIMIPPLENLALSPTEQRHPKSMQLDTLSLGDSVELMLDEESVITAALRREKKAIVQSIERIVRAFKRGGRLFYAGAGTSGRLGVLDASECPPTFQSDPEQVQGIIAGGQTALWQAVEGAEDDPEAGVSAIRFRGVNAKDVVVGIACSGRTPFVWGALAEANRRGAATILLSFNPKLTRPRHVKPTVSLIPNVGPELLTGSTRLKSGTATKLVLNMFTTLAMVRLGKVMSNLMIDVHPSNAKLRDRAVRIVQTLTGKPEAHARQALERSNWDIRRAASKARGQK